MLLKLPTLTLHSILLFNINHFNRLKQMIKNYFPIEGTNIQSKTRF